MKGRRKRRVPSAILTLPLFILVGIFACGLMACRQGDYGLPAAAPTLEVLSDTLWDPIMGPPGATGVNCFASYRTGEILAGTDIGVYRSTDGGNVWGRMSGNSSTIWGIRALCINNDGSVYACVRSPELLLRYSHRDSGWKPAATGLETSGLFSVANDSSGNLFAGTNNIGVYRSTDGSASWDLINDGLGSVVVLVLCLNDKGDLFAGTSQNGVFRLRRSGSSWSRITVLPSAQLVRAIACDALGRMMLSAGESVYRSSDHGDHWVQCPGKPGTPQILALLPIPPSTVYAGTNNGVYQSVDNGDSWSPYSVGLHYQPVYALTRNSGARLIAGTANGIYRTRR